MGPKVEDVIVEYTRVSEVVRERESVQSVPGANVGLPEDGVDVLLVNNTQSLPFSSLLFRRSYRLSIGVNIGLCASDDVVALVLHARTGPLKVYTVLGTSVKTAKSAQ